MKWKPNSPNLKQLRKISNGSGNEPINYRSGQAFGRWQGYASQYDSKKANLKAKALDIVTEPQNPCYFTKQGY